MMCTMNQRIKHWFVPWSRGDDKIDCIYHGSEDKGDAIIPWSRG